MKVLVILLWPKFEFGLEVLHNGIDAGNEVTLMECRQELLGCWGNPDHRLSYCAKCCRLRSLGTSLVPQKFTRVGLLHLTDADRKRIEQLPAAFASPDELRQFTVDGFDVGEAVTSAVITFVRDPEVDVRATAGMIRRLLVGSMSAYYSLHNFLGQQSFDRVYVYTGRLSETRAVLRVCQQRGVECSVLEVGSTTERYEIYPNSYFHNLANIEKDIWRYWNGATDPAERERLAHHYYQSRSKGVEWDFYSFVKNQKDGLLPKNFDPARTNIAIFNSSEDEFAAVGGEWENPIYANQLDALQRIRADLPRLPADITVYLRIHPNLTRLPHLTKPLLALAGPRFHVIAPDDPVSTYALMRACTKVLTFGSTTGIEAVYWGKPSILAGVGLYQSLGGTYRPKSHGELMQLLTADLAPKDRLPALQYGYRLATFGIPFRHYQPERMWGGKFESDGCFKGRRLEEGWWSHYVWAVVHRFPALEKWLNRWHARRTCRNRLRIRLKGT